MSTETRQSITRPGCALAVWRHSGTPAQSRRELLAVCLVAGRLLLELLGDPFEELLHVRQSRLGGRRVRLYDVDLMVQRLDLWQFHHALPTRFTTARIVVVRSRRIRENSKTRRGKPPLQSRSIPACRPTGRTKDQAPAVPGIPIFELASASGGTAQHWHAVSARLSRRSSRVRVPSLLSNTSGVGDREPTEESSKCVTPDVLLDRAACGLAVSIGTHEVGGFVDRARRWGAQTQHAAELEGRQPLAERVVLAEAAQTVRPPSSPAASSRTIRASRPASASAWASLKPALICGDGGRWRAI